MVTKQDRGKPREAEDYGKVPVVVPHDSDLIDDVRPRRGATDGLAIGRIVHYVVSGGSDPEIRPAIVTAVRQGSDVSLEVFGERDTLARFCSPVPFDGSDYKQGGTWHWPEGV